MFVYFKDVMCLTGKSARTARRILHGIRKKYGKGRYEMVSIEEFCREMKLTIDEVAKRLDA
jgi:hypothetical protein